MSRLVAHPLLVGVLAFLWLLLRTGRKPSRILYPCQRAALGGAWVALAVALVPFGHKLGGWLARHPARLAGAGVLSLLLVLGGVGDTSLRRPRPMPAAPAEYRATVYLVQHAGGPAGDHHQTVDALVDMMGAAGLKLHRSARLGVTSGPDGIIGSDDVVLLKPNLQWPERGGTNTDVLRGLITRILAHPDGFQGEVVVVENGQGRGNLDWPASNAEDHGQSARDVVDRFAALGYPVSAYLWDGCRDMQVAEYSAGDLRDGYVVGDWDEGTQIRVSYPKFRTAGGHYVSLRHGLWDESGSAYDNARLRFIPVPVLKCHGRYGVTAAVKIHVGTMTTSLATNTHAAVEHGGIGHFLAGTRWPDFTILDATYILANPEAGPDCSYEQATRTDALLASRDPVALDVWAAANVLVPAMERAGHTYYPEQDPADSSSTFRTYLDRSAARLLAAGIPVTNDLSRITAIAMTPIDTGMVPLGDVVGPRPNPFGSETAIRLTAGRSGPVRLDLYDLTGRRRRSIRATAQRGVECLLRWDGRDAEGRSLPAGTYFFRVTGAGLSREGKVTLVR